MTLQARTGGPPRSVIGCWALAAVVGASGSLVWIADRGDADPVGLSPSTVTSVLERMVPAGAHNVRVNGLYGSASDSAWQFTAHVSWRDDAGDLHGGAVLLPQMAGQPLLPSRLDAGELVTEERISATPATLRTVLQQLSLPAAGIQLVEYAPTVEEPAQAVRHCTAPRPGPGTCRRVTRRGSSPEEAAVLRLQAGGEAQSVTTVD